MQTPDMLFTTYPASVFVYTAFKLYDIHKIYTFL